MSSMLPPVAPIGGEDDMPCPTARLGMDLSHTYGRDQQVDDRTATEARGVDDETASDDLDRSGYLVDGRVGTIGGEKRSAGWEPNTVPQGAMPHPLSTSGTRGAADVNQGGL